MLFILPILGVALPLPPEVIDPLPVQVTGTSQLVCRSEWHKLELPLQSGKRAARQDLARVFALLPTTANLKEWQLGDADTLAIVSALHDQPWDAGEQAAAYARWLGEGPTGRKLAIKGVIKVNRVANRLTIRGTVQVTDEGKMSNRFGPNWWRDEWDHRFEGEVRINSDGRVMSVDLRDDFKVAGAYINPGSEDRNTRSGTFRLTASRPKPLSAQEALRFRRLLQQLADDEFDTRVKATEELVAWCLENPRVPALLQSAAETQTDPEVAYRLEIIRRKLPGKD